MTPEPGQPVASFRDPAGFLFSREGRILRAVNAGGQACLDAVFASSRLQKFLADGRVVGTETLDGAAAEEALSAPGIRARAASMDVRAVLQHEKIPFPSFPYEWVPEMLHAAGVLTLDLAAELLHEGVGLKDGTPYNVLFRGTEPVFVDVLSFERRDPGDPTWLPYAQFVRTFLLPLLANRYFGLPLDQIFLTRRDGLEPEQVYRWAGPFERLSPAFLGLVSIPTWLASRKNADDPGIYEKKTLSDPEKARFILRALLGRLRRSLNRLAPRSGKVSTWSDYMVSNNNYEREQFAAKEKFVQEALGEFGARSVLDAGCNTGHFSALAARSGARVVAIDYDPVVVGDVWRRARAERLDILPLVVDLTRPTPGVGWCNRECAPFLERARGGFDAVLMLALIHHMLVTERVPLEDILDLAAGLTTGIAVIEFIAPEDSMFRRLTRGRDHLHAGLTLAVFETLCRRRFDIVRSQRLEGASRWIYLLRKRV